ncbi:MAG: hypothetical protein GW938_09745 [Leptospira sp.]|nr:hypothetical protein [Leptospira sp.]NCS95552.1 hypothetical protein [Leptospira sp.]
MKRRIQYYGIDRQSQEDCYLTDGTYTLIIFRNKFRDLLRVAKCLTPQRLCSNNVVSLPYVEGQPPTLPSTSKKAIMEPNSR